jgi:hypothetical protein
MWPGQQQPGGEQNPQGPNPYQQPGYQQPNPYQQPGYQQPNPYQQADGQWVQPGVPSGPQPPSSGGKSSRNVVIAIVSSIAVIAAAVVTGVFLLKDDEDQGSTASVNSSASPSASPSESTPEEDDEANARDADPNSPRGEDDPVPDPVVSGWQVVVNPKHFSAFDVPKNDDWELGSRTTIVGWGEKDDDEDALFPTPEVAMSAPAYFKNGWCTKDSSRAVVGTKGAQGSRNTSEAAISAAQSFAYFAYNENKDNLKSTKAKPFSNEHGIKGHTATATMTGVKEESKCDSDGKVVTVSWLDESRQLRLWVLVTDAGVKDEVPEATIKEMMDSLRPYNEQD